MLARSPLRKGVKPPDVYIGLFPWRADGSVYRLGLQPACWFLWQLFAEMGNMGVELFEMSWVQSIVLFFLIWPGRCMSSGWWWPCSRSESNTRPDGPVSRTRLSAPSRALWPWGVLPWCRWELYKLSVTLQASLTSGITGYGESFDALSTDIINSLQGVDIGAAASSGVFGGIGSITSPIMVIFIIIMMGYAVIKCFFSNLKRGGVLLIQIAVGSLYMFSVPRGYMDGFCAVVQADHRSVSDHLPAGHHPYSGTAGAEGSCAAGPWPDAVGR